MAEKTEFLQAIDDAILDADSLEKFINGSEDETVLTRLSAEYPTLQKALKELFENGGLPATPFATKAEMEASELVDGDYAQVTDDTVNNGLYVKSAGTWIKSEYDPFERAKEYTTRHIEDALEESNKYVDKKIEFEEGNLLVALEDGDNSIFGYITDDGSVFLAGLDGSVQSNIRVPSEAVEFIDSTEIFTVHDSDGTPSMLLASSGELAVKDVVTPQGSLNSLASKMDKPTEYLPVYSEIYNNIDGRMSAENEPLNKEFILVDATEFEGFRSVFSPCITRLDKNTYYLVYEARETGGDYDEIFLVGRKITFDDATDEITVGSYVIIAANGDLPDGTPYTYLNPLVTYVEEGENAGRIYVHFNLMTNPDNIEERIYEPYQAYSDNLGETFTEPHSLADKFPMEDFYGALIFGPGHGTQISKGKYKNRIIIPSYTNMPPDSRGRLFSALVIYSDNGGDTWEIGARIYQPAGLNECQIVEGVDDTLVGVFRLRSENSIRYIAHSKDGGMTFSNPYISNEVAGAGTKTGFAQCANSFDYSTPKIVAICPRSPDVSPYSAGRIDAHAWVSYDNGKTFPYMKQLSTGVCQYTEAVALTEDKILFVHGGGEHSRGNKLIGNIVNINFLIGRE